ncbi:MAG: hypothetical protein RLZ57_653 [Actinomycetota bacterium]|jgi:uracil-DNA glycosylase
MADTSLKLVDGEWLELIGEEFHSLDAKLDLLANFTPERNLVFSNFSLPLSRTKVLILGQDPYPGIGNAMGLAFSTKQKLLPKSLKNIFTELYDDLGIKRTDGDLSDWHQQGVALLNTHLTTEIGKSLAHQNLGWLELTGKAIEIYANSNVVALLMGNSAAKYSSLFENAIVTSHPSPLSAYKGFFGTKPFSRINEILERRGLSIINW